MSSAPFHRKCKHKQTYFRLKNEYAYEDMDIKRYCNARLFDYALLFTVSNVLIGIFFYKKGGINRRRGREAVAYLLIVGFLILD